MTRFDTTQYQFSHGKQPKGHGSWAFCFAKGKPEEYTWFSRNATYTDAKRDARTIVRQFGSNPVVHVLP